MNPLLAALALPLLAAAPLPGKGEPPLTKQTMVSGGVRPPEQLAVTFDSVDLSFEVLPDTRSLNGVATLNFTAVSPVSRLVIDLDRNLPVRAIAIDGVALPSSAWRNPEGRLTIALPRPVGAGGRIRATISYGGTPHVAVNAPWDDGVVWSSTPAGKLWFATTAEGYGCDLFWPCLDFPAGEPGVADIHITVPKGLKAPSNGRLIGIDTLPDGRTRWHWRTRRPNTYAIALNVAPYENVSGTYKSRFGNTIPMAYWYLPGEKQQAEGLFAEFAPTLDFFESVIGPYPFADEKLGVVETPHKGMEHQTINAYGNGYAKAVEGFDWLFQHELAHEWFGNQLTAANWDDYWLHEGFGTYMQPLYGRWREGEARYNAMMDLQRAQIMNRKPLVSGKVRTEEEIYETSMGGPGQDIYYKGSWVLHTLRYLIGDPAFFRATRKLVYGTDTPRPGNFAPRYGSTAEFEALVNKAAGRDLGWFFDVYLRQAALPKLIVERTPAGAGQSETVIFRWAAPSGKAFPMPIDVQVGDRIERVAMAGGTGSLAVPAGQHIIVDPWAKILRQSDAVDALRAWQEASRKRTAK